MIELTNTDLDSEFDHLLKLNESSRLLRMMRKQTICIYVNTHQIFTLDKIDLTVTCRVIAGICLLNPKIKKDTFKDTLRIQSDGSWFGLSAIFESKIDEGFRHLNSIKKHFNPDIKWQADVWVSPKVRELNDADILKRIVSNRLLKLYITVGDFGFEDCSHSLKMLGVKNV